MDQFRSLLGDPIPIVPQHNLVTRLESLHRCVTDLCLQSFQRAGKKREDRLALGRSFLCESDHLLGRWIIVVVVTLANN